MRKSHGTHILYVISHMLGRQGSFKDNDIFFASSVEAFSSCRICAAATCVTPLITTENCPLGVCAKVEVCLWCVWCGLSGG